MSPPTRSPGTTLADDAPVAALADPAPPPDAEWERGVDLATLAALLDVVRHEVTPATFQAFELAVLQKLPGAFWRGAASRE